MILNRLLQLVKNEARLGHYVEGRDLLVRSGVLQFLREKGKPRLIQDGANREVLASHAAWSAGYAEALEDLEYFKEKYVDTEQRPVSIRRDFGSLSAAVRAGDLTEEEAQEILNGKRN